MNRKFPAALIPCNLLSVGLLCRKYEAQQENLRTAIADHQKTERRSQPQAVQ